MSQVPDKMNELAEAVRAGQARAPTVRSVLGWYGYRRRGSWIVRRIRRDLANLGLDTSPDIEDAWIDQRLDVASRSLETYRAQNTNLFLREDTGPQYGEADRRSQVIDDEDLDPGRVEMREPVPRLGNVAAARRLPLSVTANDDIGKALTLMMQHGYSQLPVMNSPRSRRVDGMVSWSSVGEAWLAGRESAVVRDCMGPPPKVLSVREPLLHAVREVLAGEAILVRGRDERIQGIVTADDISVEFIELTEPFLLVGEIEAQVRTLIEPHFALEELQSARDPAAGDREIATVDDLTFGEYVRLLEQEGNWERLGTRLDRVTFCKMLGEVRSIRNEVMHFHPDGIGRESKDVLRRAVRLLQRISHRRG